MRLNTNSKLQTSKKPFIVEGRALFEIPSLREIKQEAQKRFAEAAWPRPNEELWRRVDLTGLKLREKRTLSHRKPRVYSLKKESKDLAGLLRLREPLLTEAEIPDSLPDNGAIFKPISLLSDHTSCLLSSLWKEELRKAEDRFLLWHYSLLTEGVYLHVPSKVRLQKPFVVVFENEASGTALAPHLTVILEEEASACVIVYYSSKQKKDTLFNSATNLKIAPGATLKILEIQDFEDDTRRVHHGSAHLSERSHLLSLSMMAGGAFSVSFQTVNLSGAQSEAALRGLYLLSARDYNNCTTAQNHLVGDSKSTALFKGALSGSSYSVFQGLIEVNEGASGTDAYLSNRHLLLSDRARGDSMPKLKIRNDNVRCTHGSTTGKIDPHAVYYLMTRGLSRRQAEELALKAYFYDLVKDFKEEPLLYQHIENNLSKGIKRTLGD